MRGSSIVYILVSAASKQADDGEMPHRKDASLFGHFTLKCSASHHYASFRSAIFSLSGHFMRLSTNAHLFAAEVGQKI